MDEYVRKDLLDDVWGNIYEDISDQYREEEIKEDPFEFEDPNHLIAVEMEMCFSLNLSNFSGNYDELLETFWRVFNDYDNDVEDLVKTFMIFSIEESIKDDDVYMNLFFLHLE